ncbi:conserved hypothetical protein [uncultured Dysgonomonas sp.]|uniref:Uncharacterized protein n=1 Tax=uncultured Dysgonomonas sp. TaxID=206096 RepID=A0A212JQW3_9BACT|nr:conserved hypothetical protein [uncultured Dysgonomonas sp.]
MDIFLHYFLNLTAGIDIVQVSIKKHFEKHTGMITTAATALISGKQNTDIKLINDLIDHPNRGIIGYVFI